MINVLIDGEFFTKQRCGGITKYFNELIKRFKKYKDVEINLIYSGNLLHELEGYTNLKLHKIFQFNSLGAVGHLLNKRLFDYRVMRIANRSTFSIFHSTYYTTIGNPSIPEILTVHDMTMELFPDYYNQFQYQIIKKKQCINNAEAIITVSDNTREDLINYYNIDPDKVNTIYLGVSKRYRLLNKEEKSVFLKKYNLVIPFVIYVGNRDYHKNFWGWMRSMKNWIGWKEYDLVCIGGNKFSDSESNLLKLWNLQSKVKLLGFISEDDIIRAYNTATALIFPSIYEGFGLPILEAFACGTPVSAAKSGSIPEIGGRLINLFDLASFQEMASSLEYAIQRKGNQEFIDSCRKYVKKYSWDETARKTIDLYNSVCL